MPIRKPSQMQPNCFLVWLKKQKKQQQNNNNNKSKHIYASAGIRKLCLLFATCSLYLHFQDLRNFSFHFQTTTIPVVWKCIHFLTDLVHTTVLQFICDMSVLLMLFPVHGNSNIQYCIADCSQERNTV